MPRKRRLTLDSREAGITVACRLPASVVAYLDERARRTLTPRAALLRDAVLAELRREGRLIEAEDAEDLAEGVA